MQNWMGGTYSSFAAVTPSDSTPINCRALYVAVTGTVVVTGGPIGAPIGPVTFTAVPAGAILPIELNEGRVNAATTATGIVALA